MRSDRSFLALLLCGALISAARAGELPPAPPRAEYVLVDDLGYTDDAAARAAWVPMSGTAPVSVVRLGGRRALRMPCNFHGTKIERASWDRSVRVDLAACRGLQFDLFCADVEPLSGFSLYMRSGGGWYAARFGQTRRGGWSTVEIEKVDTRIEGEPEGWGRIDTIRISAWRGRDIDTEFYIANLGLLGADAPIAIVRGESVARSSPDEAGSVSTFSRAAAQILDHLGLSYALISDLDVTAERLRGKKIAILPHNPQMPDEVADTLVRFIQGGGKLLSFYSLHPRLGEVVGVKGGGHIRQTYRGHFASIRAAEHALPGMPPVVKQMSWNIQAREAVEGRSRVAAYWFNDKAESTGEAAILVSDNGVHMTHVLLPDDFTSKSRLVLAMLGRLAPELWEQAVATSIEQTGKFGSFAGFDEAVAGIRREAGRKGAALRAVRAAEKLRAEAVRLAALRSFPEAIAAAGEAQEKTILAYCAAQEPLRGEFRAWWCHSAFGVAGMDWDEAIKILADNGFTAILPNMLWGGTAYYESLVLPVAPEVAERGDQIAECLAACKKYGVECHPWKVNWNMSRHAPAEFVERMRREGRIQVSFGGEPNGQWLCPSHPANQKLEIDAMVEVATKYDVHGIHFDYIRYPGPAFCFCSGCRERFEGAAGAKVESWPADVRNDETLGRKWLEFRRASITKVVAAVSERVRRLKPAVKISAAVFRNWILDRDNVGQDWKVWCDRGYMDFVCPMDYESNNFRFEDMVTRQLTSAGRAPCYPGIGVSVWGPSRDIVKLIDQIKITRRLKTGGFTIFQYSAVEAGQIAPLCGQGITRKE